MLKLTVQYFCHLMQRANYASSAKTRGVHTQLDEGPETP